MKLIINESKLEKITIHWLNENFGDLTPFETDQYPNHIFYMKNGKVVNTLCGIFVKLPYFLSNHLVTALFILLSVIISFIVCGGYSSIWCLVG